MPGDSHLIPRPGSSARIVFTKSSGTLRTSRSHGGMSTMIRAGARVSATVSRLIRAVRLIAIEWAASTTRSCGVTEAQAAEIIRLLKEIKETLGRRL